MYSKFAYLPAVHITNLVSKQGSLVTREFRSSRLSKQSWFLNLKT